MCVNANIIEGHALCGKVSHFPKESAMLERNVTHSGGKERCIPCHFETNFATGCWLRATASGQQHATLMSHAIRSPSCCKRSQQHRNGTISASSQSSIKRLSVTRFTAYPGLAQRE